MKTAQAGIEAVEKAVDNVLEKVPEKLKAMLLEHFEFEGRPVPITRTEMTQMIEDMGKSLQASLQAPRDPSGPVREQPTAQQQLQGGQVYTDGFRRWPHPDGTLRKVPVGWIPPKECTLSAAFNLWIMGNAAERISPYRLLVAKDDFKSLALDENDRVKHRRRCKALLSKMKGSVQFILTIMGKTCRELHDMPHHEREHAFHDAHTQLVQKINGQLPASRRVYQRSELSYVTMYEKGKEAGL